MGDKIQEGDGLEPEFQTAFPNNSETDEEFDRRMEREAQPPAQALCRYGCGQPGQYFESGPNGGEIPRCSKQMTKCPAVHRAASRARR